MLVSFSVFTKLLIIVSGILPELLRVASVDNLRVPSFCLLCGPLDHQSRCGVTNRSTSLIAIMLGRLQMSIGECIEPYDTLGTQAFKERPGLRFLGAPNGNFSATALKEAIVSIIKQNCKEDGCRGVAREVRKCEHSNVLFRNHRCCKT